MKLLTTREEGTDFRKRFRALSVVCVLAFFAILTRLFQLQVVSADEYGKMARENILRRVTLATTRGMIRDVKGRVLASSRPAYHAYMVPGRVLPSVRPKRPRMKVGPDSFDRIAGVLRLRPDERERLATRIKEACETDDQKSPCWHPMLAREDLPRDILAEAKQHTSELPGLDIAQVPQRFYPYKNLGAHTLGYVSEIDAETLERFRPDGYETMNAEERQRANPLNYDPGDIIGTVGVERAWESHLRGQRGWEKRVVDAHGRSRNGPEAEEVLAQPRRLEPIPGRDLRLTLDMDVMAAAEKSMRQYAAGAIVVVEVKTGRILALYSKPDFDPNDLSGGNGRERVRETVNKLYTDPLHPMLDKTTSGSFQPGSTFKVFSALAGLETKLIEPDETERCDGQLSFGRRIFHCTHVHGKVDMHHALAASCNVYFYKLAEVVGMDRIAHIANEFGLGQKTGIGVNPEAPGRIPTRSWYALHYRGQFRLGFTLNAAIGQGAATTTPLQLALAYAGIGGHGDMYMPTLVKSIETDGTVTQSFPPRLRSHADVRPENLKRIMSALSAVVSDEVGTAYPVRDPALDVAGKTGTAQTGYVPAANEDPKKAWYYSQNHAWFAALAPAKNPEIAVVVLVEHGGSGPTQAAPAAMKIIREYMNLKTRPATKDGANAEAGP